MRNARGLQKEFRNLVPQLLGDFGYLRVFNYPGPMTFPSGPSAPFSRASCSDIVRKRAQNNLVSCTFLLSWGLSFVPKTCFFVLGIFCFVLASNFGKDKTSSFLTCFFVLFKILSWGQISEEDRPAG